MRTLTLYSTTTCATCSVAGRRLDAAGIPHEKVILDLPESAESLAELKKTLRSDIIQVPLLQWGTRYENIAGLTALINDYKEASTA